MAELLASPAIRPPVVASAINSGGSLEERLKMLITEKSWKVPGAVRLGIVAIAFCVLPLGLMYAQDYEAIQKRLGEAVKAGELSRAEAGVMLEALKESGKGDKARGAMRERYMQAVERAKAAVESGQMTEEQFEERLKLLRQRMFAEKQPQTHEDEDSEMEAKKRRYMAAAEEIKKAVKEGKVSKEDAEKRLIEMRKAMFRSGDRKGAKQDNDPDMAGKRRRYEEGAKQIKAAVEAGELSKEAAEKRLIKMREMIFRGVDRKDRDNGKDMAALKRRYEEGAKRIEAAVEAGRITKEDAENRLIEMRKSLFGDDKQDPDVDKQMEAKKRRYMAFAKEIEAAVDAGKISKEDAEKKLIELRKKMFRNGGRKKEARRDQRGISVEDYRRAEREIKKAVKEGKVSKEDAERRLIEMRKAIRREKPEGDDDRSRKSTERDRR